MNKTKLLLIGLVVLTVYLWVWPVPIRPLAWTPETAPEASGVLAPNDHLAALARLGDDSVVGPEAVAVDAQGRLLAGLADGRIIRVDGEDCQLLGRTDGRPLGIKTLTDGSVVIADAAMGLLQLYPGGTLEVLAEAADGIRINFADDLAVDHQGRIYFTDASWKFGIDQVLMEALEHAPNGRMMRYDPLTGEAYTLLADLYFANGVALGPDEAYVLVTETTAYRVSRFWLKGPKAGRRELFIDNLPGMPDNITFNGKDRFWLALFTPRSGLLDALAPHPFLRSVVARLPGMFHPSPSGGAHVLGLDLEGRIAESYQDRRGQAYAPITSALEHEGQLYLGSLSASGIGRVSLAALRGGQSQAQDSVDFSCPAD